VPNRQDASYPRIDLKKYAVIPVWYGCNSSCTICMLSGVGDRLGTVDPDAFSRLITALVRDGGYDNLILSGAEVTTFEQLERYVRYAASFGHFKKIQIQTNGRRLADREFLKRVVDAGVNEFFVSVHGVGETHDSITGVAGSYRETMACLDNLAGYPVNVISNTVLTRTNYHGIVPLLGELCAGPVSEMQLWNFFPMEKTDRRGLLVSLSELWAMLPPLRNAIGRSGKPLVLKGFPDCLAPEAPFFVDSDFPLNLIQDDFWSAFAGNGFGSCVHKGDCSSRECWGLSSGYLERFGDERERLTPRDGRGAGGSS